MSNLSIEYDGIIITSEDIIENLDTDKIGHDINVGDIKRITIYKHYEGDGYIFTVVYKTLFNLYRYYHFYKTDKIYKLIIQRKRNKLISSLST